MRYYRFSWFAFYLNLCLLDKISTETSVRNQVDMHIKAASYNHNNIDRQTATCIEESTQEVLFVCDVLEFQTAYFALLTKCVNLRYNYIEFQ